MLMPTPATWMVRGATFALWALAAGSVVYWGLKLGGASAAVPAPAAAPRLVAPADPAAIARLLGSTPAAAAAPPQAFALASRFQLVGVAAAAQSGAGAAIIAVDGKPARPYRVGSTLDEGLVLQSVRGRQAVVASQQTGQAVLTLELPVARADSFAGRPAPLQVPAPGSASPVLPAPSSLPPQAPTAAPR